MNAFQDFIQFYGSNSDREVMKTTVLVRPRSSSAHITFPSASLTTSGTEFIVKLI